jgi:hypothetical protein
MRQRTLGILAGVLLIGGIALGIATGIAAGSTANRNTPVNGPGIHRPDGGVLPRHRDPGQPGPFSGGPFPRPNRPNNPGPSPSI